MSSKLTLKPKLQNTFLQQFQLEKRALMLADKRRGGAALRAGVDINDVPVLIKIWPRLIDHDDSDLREIWRNEIRQLHRLAGHPSAADHIVELRTVHEDVQGFYLVLNPGPRRPLDKFLGDPDAGGRREIVKALRDRRILWANLRRIGMGLELLHSQGLLHRNLTTWSVLTEGTGAIDFQLTGFEWSMRLVSAEIHAGKATLPLSTAHSFIRDWQDFGQLAVQVLGIGPKIKNRAVANNEVNDGVTADEIRFLRQILQIIPTELVDGSFVIAKIDEILVSLDAQAKNKEPKFNIILTLGHQSPLGRKIREASGGEIEADDVIEQRKFVEADLFDPILISETVANQPSKFNLILRGQHLSYYLADYTFGPERTPSNWDAAACFRADTLVPFAQNIIQSLPLSAKAINLTTVAEMRANTGRIRERYTSWEELRRRLAPETEAASRERELRKSFALMQMLEYLFSAAELFPIQIVEQPPSLLPDNPSNVLIIKPRADDSREHLAQSLGLRESLALRLGKALQEDRLENDGSRTNSWKLTDSSILGGRSSVTTEWKFQRVIEAEDGEIMFCFSGDQSPPDIDEAYLISDDSVGTQEQFMRRMRSFKALADHGELSRMLVDPRSRILHNEEKVSEFPQFLELDDSKQKAFKATVETVPLFLVQGPPGVGKTRLVKELVRYTLGTDSSSRLLLSAQSNHAVDHLLHEIEDVDGHDTGVAPLIVRCRARERKDETSPFDIGQQTKRLIRDLSGSKLYKETSKGIRTQIDSLGESFAWTEEKWGAQTPSSKLSRRAVEGLVLRAANLVFATTNSGDLGRLIEEKAQFDWSIIEEAGKATGGELISPLLLSHRRLMIGDHKQLPPFGAERILTMLAKPKAVRKALQRGDSMIGRVFRDQTIDEIFSDLDAADSGPGELAFANLCNEATKMFSLFETIIENEFERQELGRSGRPIAMPLTAQHRMHPAIAKIVSNAFYKNILVTDPVREIIFRTEPSPVMSVEPERLPNSPVVWINMPWVQNTLNMKIGEEQPRYTNGLELLAVESVLKLLTVPSDQARKPSLAILSPYSRQVARLNSLVEHEESIKMALSKFVRAPKQKTFCSTVDSFQGSEADCIIISLVRNNNLATVSSALGFLSDSRRMNVLMSRARWKLIVIGSLDFLDSVLKCPKPAGDAIKIEFLEKLIGDLNPAVKDDNIQIVQFDILKAGTQ